MKPAAIGGIERRCTSRRETAIWTPLAALVDGGADINQVERVGQLHARWSIAISNGHFDLAKYLLDHGAEPNLATDDGLTPLYATLETQYAPTSWSPTRPHRPGARHPSGVDEGAARSRAPTRTRGWSKKLWFRPSDHDDAWIGTAGTTPFWRAAFANDVEAMRLLVAAAPIPNIPSTGGQYAADGRRRARLAADDHRAVPDARLAAVELCLELGNDVNAPTTFRLHRAARRRLPRRQRPGQRLDRQRGANRRSDRVRNDRHRHGEWIRGLQQPAARASGDGRSAGVAWGAGAVAASRWRVRLLQRIGSELPRGTGTGLSVAVVARGRGPHDTTVRQERSAKQP